MYGFKMKQDLDSVIQPREYGQKKGQDPERFSSNNFNMPIFLALFV